MKEEFTPDFLIVPKETMKLPPADRFVFGAVYWYTRLSLGKCIASNVELGRTCGIKPHSITASLDRLEEAKLITRTYKDEQKRHRDQIICLVGFGKLESSGMIIQSPLVKTLESSTEGHIKNTIKNKYIPQDKPVEENFSSENYFKQLLNSSKKELAVIAYYTLKRRNHENVSSPAQAQRVIARNIKVAKRLADFESDKIKKAINECESTVIRGEPMKYTLETVEKFLLK